MSNLTLTNEDNMALMARYPDQYFALAIVDPPYFDGPQRLGYYGKEVSSKGVTRGYQKVGHWDLPTASYFAELRRVSQHQIIWGCNYYESLIAEAGIGPGRLVWDKLNGASSFNDAEIAAVSCNDRTEVVYFKWNGFMQGVYAGPDLSLAMRQQGNKALNEKRIHATQKPVALYKWLLGRHAKPGDRILDTHLGSGSIAIACHDLGFDLMGCELDSQIFAAMSKRVREHQGQLSLSFPSSSCPFFSL